MVTYYLVLFYIYQGCSVILILNVTDKRPFSQMYSHIKVLKRTRANLLGLNGLQGFPFEIQVANNTNFSIDRIRCLFF